MQWVCVGALLLVVVVAVLAVIAMYNRLVTLRARVDNAWSQITVQLRRRYDLIPNLVETVKGYAAHESTVFEKVTAGASGSGRRAGCRRTSAGREHAHLDLAEPVRGRGGVSRS